MSRIFIVLTLDLILPYGISNLELQSYTACYGTTGLSNFLQPTCGSERIAPVGVYTNAKTLESNCPDTIDSLNQGTTPTSCCEYDPKDCEVLYRGSVYRAYYQQCNGQLSCIIRVSWIPTPCDQDVYLARTNYMKMDFYCISDQALDTCENLVATDSPTFLWNSGYPSSPMSGSTCSCSVEVDCDTTIRITAIDLRLNSSDGECKQSIVIEDGGSTARFDCTNNNDYLPTVLYTSTSHYIEISVNNELGTTGGYYFISVQGTNPSGSIRLACGTTSQSSPSTDSSLLPVCPGSQSTTLSSTATSTSTNSAITISPSTVQSTLVDTSIMSANTMMSSTYYTTIQSTSSVVTKLITSSTEVTPTQLTQDATIQNTDSVATYLMASSTDVTATQVTQDGTIQNTDALTTNQITTATDAIETQDSKFLNTDSITTSLLTSSTDKMADTSTRYDNSMLTTYTTDKSDMSATTAISISTVSTNEMISSTMSAGGGTMLTDSYLNPSMTPITIDVNLTTTSVSGASPIYVTTNDYLLSQMSLLQSETNIFSNEIQASPGDISPSFASLKWSSTEPPAMSSAVLPSGCCVNQNQDRQKSTESSEFTWVAAIVVIVVIIGIIIMVILHREKIKECCVKTKDTEEEEDIFGNYVPAGRVGALPPLQHTHTFYRENTLSFRPLSPIKSNDQKVRTSLNLKNEIKDDVEISLTDKQVEKIRKNTSLPPIDHSTPMRSRLQGQMKKEAKKRKKMKSEKEKRKRSVRVSHGVPVTEADMIQKEIQRETEARQSGRRMSVTATVDVSGVDGSFRDSFTSKS